MQAIARVNRVFKDKPGGLIVDYIGIGQNLRTALGDYSGGDRDKTGISQAEAVAVMLEKYEIVKDMFFGFDYSAGLKGEAKDRLAVLFLAITWKMVISLARGFQNNVKFLIQNLQQKKQKSLQKRKSKN